MAAPLSIEPQTELPNRCLVGPRSPYRLLCDGKRRGPQRVALIAATLAVSPPWRLGEAKLSGWGVRRQDDHSDACRAAIIFKLLGDRATGVRTAATSVLGLFPKLPKRLQQAIPVRDVQRPHFFEMS
jgi:hypothetical protein